MNQEKTKIKEKIPAFADKKQKQKQKQNKNKNKTKTELTSICFKRKDGFGKKP